MSVGLHGGLGRGLDILLKGEGRKRDDVDVYKLPIDAIIPNPHQLRKEFLSETLEELCESIRQQGVLQPILVRVNPASETYTYQLIAGERRWRASKMAGLKVIPAIIREISDEDSLAIAIIENLQREDLNALDQAYGLQVLQDTLKLSQDALALKVGKSRPAVANLLRLLQLPPAIQSDVRLGYLSASHARTILSINDPAQQLEFRRLIEDLELSVRKAEFFATYWNEHREFPPVKSRSKVVTRNRIRSKQCTQVVSSNGHLFELQQRLAEILPVSVQIHGNMQKGQIILGFFSSEELHSLLSFWGVCVGSL